MSSSAALAAAKKRRNVGLGEQQNRQMSNQQQLKPQKREPLTIPQLVTQHDARIFVLEKKSSQEKGGNLKEDLENMYREITEKINQLNNKPDTNIDTNALTNKIEKNEKDIVGISTSTKTMNKHLVELKSANAKLQATTIEQSKEIEKLKKLFSEYVMEKNTN